MPPQFTYKNASFSSQICPKNTLVFPSASSGKEKDSETGYYYFGARYYNPDLSLWLSVDPMSDKYPSLSPYNYCAWNPLKIVDPDGNEIGDYYDRSGKYLGWDGQFDNKVYIIDDYGDQTKISSSGKTSLSELKQQPALSTTYDILSEALDVFERTQANGGYKEESSLLDGRVVYRGETGDHLSTRLPFVQYEITPTDGVSIHSHPNDRYATFMSDLDAAAFRNYHQNVIVGPVNNLNSKMGAAFYPQTDIKVEPFFILGMDVVKKICGQQSNRNFQHHFEKQTWR